MPAFREHVYSRSDADVIVLPLLKALYEQIDYQSNEV